MSELGKRSLCFQTSGWTINGKSEVAFSIHGEIHDMRDLEMLQKCLDAARNLLAEELANAGDPS